jgi:phenylacetate-CoA ligase
VTDRLNPLEEFVALPLEAALKRHLAEPPQEHALKLFRDVAQTVPAYHDFLSGNAIDAAAIRNYNDFKTLPLTTKQNYMLAYPLPQLCREGRLDRCEMMAVSSGSTGKPLFWPRTSAHELDIARRFEQVFLNFQADRKSTLVVVCFALGTWVGGMYTATCCRYLSQKGYRLTLVTPGNNKGEIFRVIDELGPQFEQVVLAGYPPFIKDVIDSGTTLGIEWRRLRVKLILAGEVFSEEWRSLVCERLGARDPAHDTASLYGTADGGVLGVETPLSISIRRFLADRPDAAREVFGEPRLPTLVQYDPLSRFFETHEGTLVVTGDNGVPLVRYHIADKGGVFAFSELLEKIRELGGDLLANLGGSRDRLPFVYLFGRADFTVSYFGANVYPENVTVGLEQPNIRDWVSGKFVLEVKETEDRDKMLRVVVELAPGVTATEDMRVMLVSSILEQLLRLNSEFANYVPAQYQLPEVTLKPSGDPEYFPVGVKHRYTRR